MACGSSPYRHADDVPPFPVGTLIVWNFVQRRSDQIYTGLRVAIWCALGAVTGIAYQFEQPGRGRDNRGLVDPDIHASRLAIFRRLQAWRGNNHAAFPANVDTRITREVSAVPD